MTSWIGFITGYTSCSLSSLFDLMSVVCRWGYKIVLQLLLYDGSIPVLFRALPGRRVVTGWFRQLKIVWKISTEHLVLWFPANIARIWHWTRKWSKKFCFSLFLLHTYFQCTTSLNYVPYAFICWVTLNSMLFIQCKLITGFPSFLKTCNNECYYVERIN